MSKDRKMAAFSAFFVRMGGRYTDATCYISDGPWRSIMILSIVESCVLSAVIVKTETIGNYVLSRSELPQTLYFRFVHVGTTDRTDDLKKYNKKV